MRKLLVFTVFTMLVACSGPEIDHVGENDRMSCEFLLEETRSNSAEVLHLRPPLEVHYFGPCTCGVRYWDIVNSDESTVRICLQDYLRSMMSDSGNQRFGIGGCHGQPDDIMFPLGSAAESAIIGVLSLWMVDKFSLEELVAAGTQPDRCLA